MHHIESVTLDELECWHFQHGQAQLLVAKQGAQVLSYQVGDEPPIIWLNDKAQYKHGQGIRTLGRELVVEAVAPDGLIEAIRLDHPDTFLLAVQWHPEWKVTPNPFYLGIFKRFAEAVRRRAHARI